MEDMNVVRLSGKLMYAEKVNNVTKGVLKVERNSGTSDYIPFVTKQHISIHADYVSLSGKVHTKNVKANDGKNHKLIYVFADNVFSNEYCENKNSVEMECALVRKDELRETPKGKTIMDIIVAANTKQGDSHYPSAIVWGSVAEKLSKLPIGTKLYIRGRFQSREYFKETETGRQVRTAYEISVATAEEV